MFFSLLSHAVLSVSQLTPLIVFFPHSGNIDGTHDVTYTSWLFHCLNNLSIPLRFLNYTSGAGTAYPSGAPEFTPRFFVGFVLLDL
jgi:hypothetical protein